MSSFCDIKVPVAVKAKLIASNEDVNGYTTYVFKNLEPIDWLNEYIMCVKYPNWEGKLPEKNIVGYLQYTYIYAGTSYYNRLLDKEDKYQFSHIRFDKFVPEEKEIDNTIVI